ncbi:O-antigen ligase family protein [Streptacidiphilus monticola]|uniref:O-antigen ligase family protein n=1 Tax=Streptacidiphilus monticola TaxID=2161674 RepID=A0ABW1GBH3_9ACTN
MSLREIIAVFRRRWYVMAPITVLALLAGIYLGRSVPMNYQSQSSLALLDSTAVAKLAPTYGNNISNAGGPLVVTADVLIRSLMSADAAQALAAQGVTDEYLVSFAPDTSGPLLSLTVKGSSRAQVLRETSVITDFAGEQLAALQRQAGVPQHYFIQATAVVLPEQPVAQPKSKIQYVAAVVIGGLAAAFLLSALLDCVMLARRRRRTGELWLRWPPAKSRGTFLDRRLDGVSILSVYLALALFIPSNMCLPALGGIGTPANVFALLGLFWYLAAWLGGWMLPARGTRAPRVALCVLAAAVLGAYLADATRQTPHSELLAADRGLIGLLVWVALVVLASAATHERHRLDTLMRRLIVLASVVALLGFYDFFFSTNIADSIHIPGLSASSAGITTMDRGGFTRPRSTTAQPLEFGGMLAILLPFAIQQALDPIRRHRSLFVRWAPVALIGGALPLTVSKTSIIGAAIVVLIMVPRWKPQRRWAAIGVLLAGVAALKVAVPGLIGTLTGAFSSFFGAQDTSTQARTVKYAEIWPYIVQRPWFGRGFGTFDPQTYFFTDNEYMLATAEMGLLGLLALFVLFFTGIHQGGAIRRLAQREQDRELGQAFFASAAVALVISATFDSLGFAMFAGVFFLLLGAGGAYLGFVRREARAVYFGRLGLPKAAGERAVQPNQERRLEPSSSPR